VVSECELIIQWGLSTCKTTASKEDLKKKYTNCHGQCELIIRNCQTGKIAASKEDLKKNTNCHGLMASVSSSSEIVKLVKLLSSPSGMEVEWGGDR
jgi:hypothetical protein